MTDEMKPVRCGCGGEAVIYVTHWWGKCYVCECEECGTASRPCTTEAEAITTWNRAMGATDMNVGDKERTAKVIDRRYNGTALGIVGLADSSYGTCENCWGDVLDRYTYCPHCGARLGWE